MTKIGILGAGAWGRALASIIAQNADIVMLYGLKQDFLDISQLSHLRNLYTTNHFDELFDCNLFVLALPVQHIRSVILDFYKKIEKHGVAISHDVPFIIGSKGIENQSLKFISEILVEILGNQCTIGAISGPNFASEVMKKKAAIANLACSSAVVGLEILKYFSNDKFRTNYIDDLMGVQICGALKNVYAIASGMIHGFSLGANAQSAFLSAAIKEMSLLVGAFGGNKDTIISAAGVGDLLLTCMNSMSRNMEFGCKIALGADPLELVKETTVEGFHTALAIYKKCNISNLNAKIINLLYKILYNNYKSNPLEKKQILYEAIFSYS